MSIPRRESRSRLAYSLADALLREVELGGDVGDPDPVLAHQGANQRPRQMEWTGFHVRVLVGIEAIAGGLMGVSLSEYSRIRLRGVSQPASHPGRPRCHGPAGAPNS